MNRRLMWLIGGLACMRLCTEESFSGDPAEGGMPLNSEIAVHSIPRGGCGEFRICIWCAHSHVAIRGVLPFETKTDISFLGDSLAAVFFLRCA